MTGAFHSTSKNKLDVELGWETVEKRSDILSLNIFQKIHLYETGPLIRNCMPKLDTQREHSLRSKGGYIPFKNYGSKFKNSYFPYTSGIWNNIPKGVQCKDLTEFKDYTKTMKPNRYKHFSRGNKLSNSLFTKIRVGQILININLQWVK